MHLILRRRFVHPVDPLAEDRPLHGDSLFETVVGRSRRLPLQRQPNAPPLQYVVGDADEIECLGNADVRNGLIQNLLRFDGCHSAVERPFEHRAVRLLRLKSDRRGENRHHARPLVEFPVTEHLVESEVADDLRQFGVALPQRRFAARKQRFEIAARRLGPPAAGRRSRTGSRCRILCVVHRFEPRVFVSLRIGLDCQMRKPAVGRRSVPVDHVGCDLHHVAGQQQPCRLAPLLIIASSGRDDQQLPAGMAVPVVAASGAERHIRHRTVQCLAAHERRKESLTDKIG